jgi:hypothetical protein
MSLSASRTIVSSSLIETTLLVDEARRARSTKSIIDRYGAIGDTDYVASAGPADGCPKRCSNAVA